MTRLDWLKMVQGEIEAQFKALVREQDLPAPPATAYPDTKAVLDDRANAAVAGKENAGSDQAVSPEHDESNDAMTLASPFGAHLVRLAEIRQQLNKAEAAALDLKKSWTSPPAVTLELSLVGSFGFWVTVGLLAAWPLTEAQTREGNGEMFGGGHPQKVVPTKSGSILEL